MTGDKVQFTNPDDEQNDAEETKPATKNAPKTERGKGDDKYQPYVW